MIVVREVLGEELRRRRLDQGRTLRQVSEPAVMSVGYLSNVERGQKEISSELLVALCDSLDASLSEVLASVACRVAELEARDTMRVAA